MTNVVRTDKALTATAPPVTLSKRLHNALGRDWGWAWFLMLPTVLLMGGIIAYPFLHRGLHQLHKHRERRDRPIRRVQELY